MQIIVWVNKSSLCWDQEMINHSNQGVVQLAVNKQNSLGWAPLLAAASRGHMETVDLLLKCNARVDVFDNEGRSALHLAAGWSQLLEFFLFKSVCSHHKVVSVK